MEAINKYVFLLGGHDLEMIEIRNILERLNLKEGSDFFDRDLSWGAKLSSYKDCFNDNNTFVGVELNNDIEQPKNYIEVDHHNENSVKPSSIEQVSELLNVKLNHFQKLVAANDKGFIPAMEKLGATYEEIRNIRESDRKSQGVTERDEKLAIESLKSKITDGNLIIVESLSQKFSTITDRLYPFENLIIYNEASLVYYGGNIKILIEEFKEFVERNEAFYGGGENGYFGFTEKVIVYKNEIKSLLDEIVKILKYE